MLLIPTLVSAQLSVPQGGTGKNMFPIGSLIYSDTNLRLNGTTSPVVGSITATSTTATSTFPRVSITGAISLLGEYFTNFTNYVRSLFSGTSPITYNSGTGAIGCTTADGTHDGCLSQANWTTFNNKVSSQWVDGGSGKLYYTGGNVGIGTTSPLGKLHIRDNSTAAQIWSNYSAGTNMKDWRLGFTSTAMFLGTLNEGSASTGDAAITIARETNSNDVDYIEFATNNEASKMRFDNSGNLGVGTSSPKQKLSVSVGGNYSAANEYAGIGLTSGNSTYSTAYGIGRTAIEAYYGIAGASGAYANGTTAGDVYLGLGTSEDLHFGTAGTIKMTINSSGNVGIGTTTPGALLELYKNATSEMRFSGDLSTASGDALGIISFATNDTSLTAQKTVAKIQAEATESYASDTDSGSALTFFTTPNNNSATTLLERMRITEDGNVGIGTTSPFKKLSVVGEGWFTSHLTAANITATGTLKMADVGNDLKFSADNTYDIGASAASRPRNVYIAGTATIGGVTTLASTLTGLLYGVSGVVTASSSLQFDTTNGDVVIGGAGLKGALHLKPINTANNWFTIKNDDNGSNEGLSIGKGAYPANTDLVNISPAALVTSLGAGAGFKAFNTGVAGVTYGLGGLNSFYTGQALTVGGSGSVNLQTYAGAWLTRLSVANDGKINVGTSTAHSSGMTLANGDLYVATSTGAISGVVLQASDASCHRITVDASNVISAATVPCP